MLELLGYDPPTYVDGESMTNTIWGSEGRKEIRAIAVDDRPILYRSTAVGSWIPVENNQLWQKNGVKKPTPRWQAMLDEVGY